MEKLLWKSMPGTIWHMSGLLAVELIQLLEVSLSVLLGLHQLTQLFINVLLQRTHNDESF